MFHRVLRYEHDVVTEVPPPALRLSGVEHACDLRLGIEFKAIEEERRRVAKELHDEILPALVRLIRSIQSQDNRHRAESLLEELHATASAFRDLLGELHPVDLEELGLVAALNNTCSRYARLTGLFIAFIERSEQCSLSSQQQLFLYRAMQAVLRMFANSDNDILIVTYDHVADSSVIVVRCVDKRVKSANWLSAVQPDFSAFQSWCAMSGATVEIGTNKARGFPRDLVLSIGEQQFPPGEHRLLQSPTISDDDCAMMESIAVEAERKRIYEDINRAIMPLLAKIVQLANDSKNDLLAMEVGQRIEVIATGVAGIMSELHRRLVAEAGLVASLKSLVDRFKRASAIGSELRCRLLSDELDISAEAKFAIFRVVQEALNNVEKHAAASRVAVTIKQAAGALIVTVEDNGRGFFERRNWQSRGVNNMRERAVQVGARVSWQRAVSFTTGTLVTISLPATTPGEIHKHG